MTIWTPRSRRSRITASASERARRSLTSSSTFRPAIPPSALTWSAAMRTPVSSGPTSEAASVAEIGKTAPIRIGSVLGERVALPHPVIATTSAKRTPSTASLPASRRAELMIRTSRSGAGAARGASMAFGLARGQGERRERAAGGVDTRTARRRPRRRRPARSRRTAAGRGRRAGPPPTGTGDDREVAKGIEVRLVHRGDARVVGRHVRPGAVGEVLDASLR